MAKSPRPLPLGLALALAVGLATRALGQPAEPDPVRSEELRRTVELALADALRPQSRSDVQVDRFVAAAHELARAGTDVVPALGTELDQALPSSYYFAGYVLGLIGGPGAAQALEGAIARAESEEGEFALSRKSWACYALGLLGRVDALDTLNTGRHRSAGIAVHAGMSTLEAIAVLTAPASIPVLVAQLERYDDESDPNASQRALVLEALARVGDETTIPAIARVLGDSRAPLRHRAARAIGRIGAPESRDLLLSALADPDSYARTGAMVGMRSVPDPAAIPRLLDHLEREEDAVVRGDIYQFVVRVGTPEDMRRVVSHAGRPDPMDRRLLLRAMAEAPPEVALPVLGRGLADRDPSVAVLAATSVQMLGDPRGVDLLLPVVARTEWAPAQAAVDALAALGDPRGATPILARLLDTELPQPITDPRQRLRIEKLLVAAVALGDTSRLTDLEAALDATSDGQVRQLLTRHIDRLRTIADAAAKPKRWIAALDSSNPDVRLLAYANLRRLGGESAARALVERFGRVDPAEAREILRALASRPGPAARDLVRRVLVDPAFDPAEHAELRDMAAWAALQIAGEPMLGALREAVIRRDGRDGRPFLYYAVLAGTGAIADIDRLRVPRLRYLGSTRGVEDEQLQWAKRELRTGRSISALNVPPERLGLD